MKILVIGNGFDIAHGLPTTYKEFLDFITKRECEEFFTDEIEKQLEDNIWIEHFQNIAADTGDNWIDFETEIARVIRAIEKENLNEQVSSIFSKTTALRKTKDHEKNRLISFNQLMDAKYGNGKSSLNFSFKELRNKLVMDLNIIQVLLDKYLGYVLHTKKIKPINQISKFRPDAVLSFNYTDTYKRLYGAEEKIKYDYIHGKISEYGDKPKGKIVLGINEHLNDDEKNSLLNYIEFRKYYQRIFKGTGMSYKDWLYTINKQAEDYIRKLEDLRNGNTVFASALEKYPTTHQAIFYGHSIDVSDKDILKEIILTENVYCSFYYHNEKALQTQITNLVKIIGQDELIKRTGGSKAKIKFCEIQKDTST